MIAQTPINKAIAELLTTLDVGGASLETHQNVASLIEAISDLVAEALADADDGLIESELDDVEDELEDTERERDKALARIDELEAELAAANHRIDKLNEELVDRIRH